MVGEDYAKAYVEVLACLQLLSKEEFQKIPEKIIQHFEKNKDLGYNFRFDTTRSFQEQKLSNKANSINLLLYLNYFATENVKNKIEKKLEENEKKYQEELSKKYKIDNLFKDKKIEKIENTVSMVEYKESIFIRIIKKIKVLLKI